MSESQEHLLVRRGVRYGQCCDLTILKGEFGRTAGLTLVAAHLAVVLPVALILGSDLFIAGICWNLAQEIDKIPDIHYKSMTKSSGGRS
jgi:hypothetical protein